MRRIELIAALGVLVVSGAVLAQQPSSVTKIRTEKVTLYSAAEGGQALRDVKREEFKGPWKIHAVATNKMLQVEVDGASYWVRPFAVETNVVVRAPSECGVKVAKKTEKAGATRGLGEECKP